MVNKTMRIFAVACLWLPLVAFADIEASMLDNISDAKKRLQTTETRITQERLTLGGSLRSLEQEVLKLRDQTATARRQMDERTLSLSQLEERLKSWQDQDAYQKNLLNRFLQSNHVDAQLIQSDQLAEKASAAVAIAKELYQSTSPQWTNESVVLDGGRLADAHTLRLGPVVWYMTNDNAQAGFAQQKVDFLESTSTFDADRQASLQSLNQQGAGSVLLDPSLGGASVRAEASESIVEHVHKGGFWVIPILVFGGLATLIALLKAIQLVRLPSVVAVPSRRMLSADSALIEKFKGMQAELYKISAAGEQGQALDDALFVQLHNNKHRLEHWLGVIAVTAAVAPLLGLLGTVSGMIETFQMMTAFGSSDPEVVSGGIAKALVTTELGLVVAIPALIIHALLSRYARRYYDALESFAIVISSEGEADKRHDVSSSTEGDDVGGSLPQGAGA